MNDETLYDLETVTDLEAWHTHEIRSHRRARSLTLRQPMAVVVLLAVLAPFLTTSISTVQHVPTGRPEIPLSLQWRPGVPPTKVDPLTGSQAITADDRAALRAGRSEARKMPPPVPTKPEVSKLEKVIGYAMAQQGDRYSWGAAGPNSFDCSGLVMMAFKQVGINLPHYTGTMLGYGSKVTRSQLQRGDLIFPTSGHVAIYLGNGKQIAASSGNGKVIVQTVSSFYAGRRLL